MYISLVSERIEQSRGSGMGRLPYQYWAWPSTPRNSPTSLNREAKPINPVNHLERIADPRTTHIQHGSSIEDIFLVAPLRSCRRKL
jgi:hypothetical protein